MKVAGLVVVVISIGSSVVAAPSSNSATTTAAAASANSDSELERRKLGYAAVELNATATLPYYYVIVLMHFDNFCYYHILGPAFPTWTAVSTRIVHRTGHLYKGTRWTVGGEGIPHALSPRKWLDGMSGAGRPIFQVHD